MNSAHWEQRYQTGDTRWEKGAPAPGLVDFLAAHPNLPRGTVLVPGCGTGHDVRAFSAAGFKATALDFAPSAIALAKERTQAAGLRARFLRQDFLRGKPLGRFDWLFEHTLFCAIMPADREAYVRAVLRWLKPDGQFLAIHYLIAGEGSEPPFGVTRRELWERFSPHFELVAEWTPRSYPNRVGLEQMLWWRRRREIRKPKLEARRKSATRRSKSQTSARQRRPLTSPGTSARSESRAGSSPARRARC